MGYDWLHGEWSAVSDRRDARGRIRPRGHSGRARGARGGRQGAAHGFRLELTEYPWGCDYFVANGVMMPADALDTLKDGTRSTWCRGAFPRPPPDHLSLWGLLIPIRRTFPQFMNLRPVRLCRASPVACATYAPDQVDMVSARNRTRASTRRSAAGCTAAPTRNSRSRSRCSRGGRRPGRALPSSSARRPGSLRRDEVERDRSHDAVLGRAGGARHGSAPASETE